MLISPPGCLIRSDQRSRSHSPDSPHHHQPSDPFPCPTTQLRPPTASSPPWLTSSLSSTVSITGASSSPSTPLWAPPSSPSYLSSACTALCRTRASLPSSHSISGWCETLVSAGMSDSMLCKRWCWMCSS
ncbi:unnamed protein product [Camellia sinensis]